MTRFKFYSNYIACLLGTLIAFELCWIGAKYVIEGEVVHTYLDHFIAVCGSFYLTRDTMKLWLKLQTKSQKVQIAAHMIGLNYKRPYIRHGRRYYKPYRDYFYSALSGPDYETLRKMEKKGYVVSGKPGEKGIYFWMTREGLDWLGEKLRIQIHDPRD